MKKNATKSKNKDLSRKLIKIYGINVLNSALFNFNIKASDVCERNIEVIENECKIIRNVINKEEMISTRSK